ncbi:hypothetical protein HCX48_10915 [Rhodocyclus tenuis]|uniref:XRE family transcriptional regulator n=1 Tax=Rhodocyclus gracilis TaxID=2929842 RepID=A0ABX0WJ30_9RHOO|nr:hypothetical protein [Rhodocyclus gracilis]NJA89728.1 hypothetical protein [Rhodocyclus gracilis]
MSIRQDQLSIADELAALISGNASMGYVGAAVQRSHRFPLHIISQIENMARKSNSPISLIINQLLECGIDAVLAKLSDEDAKEIKRISPEQLARATASDKQAGGATKASAQRKTDRTK